MSEYNKHDVFLHQLDEILSGRSEGASLSDEDYQALNIARQLAQANLSADSRRRLALRQELLSKVTINAQRQKRRAFMYEQPRKIFQITVIVVALLFMIVGMGWAIRTLLPYPDHLPAAPGMNLPAGLTVEEYAIKALPDLDVMDWQAFEPQNSEDIGLLDKHRAERDVMARRMEFNNNLLLPFACQLEGRETQYHVVCEGRSLNRVIPETVEPDDDTEILDIGPLSGFSTVSVNASGDNFLLLIELSDGDFLLTNTSFERMDAFSYPPVFVGDDVMNVEFQGERGLVVVKRAGQEIYRVDVGDPATLEPVHGLWAYGDHWAMETIYVKNTMISDNEIDSQATGQVVLDGQLLNETLGYEETFNFGLIDGRPFYFYRQAGRIGISFDGQEIPLDYEDVLHYQCCSAGVLNPGFSTDMTWFFARRGEQWHYVEVGVFAETDRPTPLPVATATQVDETVEATLQSQPTQVDDVNVPYPTWQEYEAALVDAILLPADDVEGLCEWEVWGHDEGVEYIWAYCVMTSSSTAVSVPAVVIFGPEGAIMQVDVPQDGDQYEPSIRQLFPVDVQERIFANPNPFDFDAASQRIEQRRSDPSIPPLLIFPDQSVTAPSIYTQTLASFMDGWGSCDVTVTMQAEGGFIWPSSATQVATYFFPDAPGLFLAGTEFDLALAANDGVVAYAGWSNLGLGNLVVLAHGNDTWSLYAHLSEIMVTRCSVVQQGQEIGRIGSTGKVLSAGLYFATYRDDDWLNPQEAISPELFSSSVYETYVVKEGDTLLSIAFTFDASVQDLIALNDLSSDGKIFVGQSLWVPERDEAPSSSSLPPETGDMDVETQVFESPLGVWKATVSIASPNEESRLRDQIYRRVEVVSRHEVRWLLLDEWSLSGLGSGTPVVLGWSPDERWMYLADSVHPDGCAGFPKHANFRLVDLLDGTSRPVLDIWGVASLSPDQQTLAVVEQRNVRLVEMETLDERIIPYTADADDWDSGDILWSLDESTFEFSVVKNPCGSPEQSVSFTLQVDLVSATITILGEGEK